MDQDPLIAMLTRLKLTAIRDQFDSLIDEAARRDLTIREAVSLFCEREIARKDERRIEMSIGLARFPFVRDLESFDFAAQPSIDKKQVRELAAGRFIGNAEALRLLGPPGRREDPSRRRHRAPGDPDRLYGAVHCRADARWRSWPRRIPRAGSRSGSPSLPSPSC